MAVNHRASFEAEYEFDGFKTGGMRAKSVEINDNDVSDYVPALDYVLVSVEDEAEKKTPGGLILPDKVVKDPVEGRVVAAGPGNHQNGTFIANRVHVGDWVRFGQWAASPERRITIGGAKYLLMREEDILMFRPSKKLKAAAK